MTAQIIRDFELPVGTEPNTLYLIAKEDRPDLPLSAYVTDKENQLRTLFSMDVVNEAIQTAVGEGVNTRVLSKVVADLTERDALELASDALVLVRNNDYAPSAQQQGPMCYFFVHETREWFPIAGGVGGVASWETISGKPVSSVASIDEAVEHRHTHGNKEVLDQISESSNGQLTYKGTPLSNVWLTRAEF